MLPIEFKAVPNSYTRASKLSVVLAMVLFGLRCRQNRELGMQPRLWDCCSTQARVLMGRVGFRNWVKSSGLGERTGRTPCLIQTTAKGPLQSLRVKGWGRYMTIAFRHQYKLNHARLHYL